LLEEKPMRTALAVAIALLISGPASAEAAAEAAPAGAFVATDSPIQVAQFTARSEPAQPQRANVPRTTGTGLSGVPTGGQVMGMSPVVATVLGIVIVGGIVAVAVSDDDDEPAPAGTGSGGS
jgi:hypothetical protein